MMRLNVVEFRQSLAEVLNRAEYQGERIIIHRRGKDAAALIPLEDLKLLERSIEEAEDRIDVEAARASLAESGDRIPYSAVRRTLGLDDEQEARPTRAGAEPRRYEIQFTRAAEPALASLPRDDLGRIDAAISTDHSDCVPAGSYRRPARAGQ